MTKDMEYILPDKTRLLTDYFKKYGEEFLKLNNLKVGDTTKLRFPYHTLHSKYHSRQMDKCTDYKEVAGILKIDQDGILYAESIDDMNFYFSRSNGLSGRSFKSWYELKRQKSIIKFGDGISF